MAKNDCTKHGNETHGMTKSPEYKAWSHAKSRCHNPADPVYDRYGGRGIIMCEEWRNNFSAFIMDIGTRPANNTLERIDNNLGYFPDNCIWATMMVQGRNKRNNRMLTFQGETLSVSEWAEKVGLEYNTLSYRLCNGWSVEKALTTKVMKNQYS